MSSRIIQVGLLATYLRELVESNTFLQDVWVEGEVSSYTVPGSGHAYFAIKDEAAAVDCVMWKQTRLRQSFQPRVGDKIVVHGGATVYEKNSRFQIKADVVLPAGAGILQLQLEQLKQRLDTEGLFDPSRKRTLPPFPNRIGVVTSSTGAVWHDIVQVVERRFPLVELVLAPATVQGEQAPDSVVAAIQRLQHEDVELILVARGGGSAEDLWAFNDERIARAVFASRVAVISAIGHETDTTVIDLVADVRAPTPSAAAEMMVPDISALQAFARDLERRCFQLTHFAIDRRRRETADLHHRLTLMSPATQLAAMRALLTAERFRMRTSSIRAVERYAHTVERGVASLVALDPAALLQRGYAHVTMQPSGEPVRQAGMLNTGDHLRATFADGSIRVTVDDIDATPVRIV
ncbi:exodeoxyribonuclease VII large subunit [soil metagenome]